MSTVDELISSSQTLYRDAQNAVKNFLQEPNINMGMKTLNKIATSSTDLRSQVGEQMDSIDDFSMDGYGHVHAHYVATSTMLDQMYDRVNTLISKYAERKEREEAVIGLKKIANNTMSVTHNGLTKVGKFIKKS